MIFQRNDLSDFSLSDKSLTPTEEKNVFTPPSKPLPPTPKKDTSATAKKDEVIEDDLEGLTKTQRGSNTTFRRSKLMGKGDSLPKSVSQRFGESRKQKNEREPSPSGSNESGSDPQQNKAVVITHSNTDQKTPNLTAALKSTVHKNFRFTMGGFGSERRRIEEKSPTRQRTSGLKSTEKALSRSIEIKKEKKRVYLRQALRQLQDKKMNEKKDEEKGLPTKTLEEMKEKKIVQDECLIEALGSEERLLELFIQLTSKAAKAFILAGTKRVSSQMRSEIGLMYFRQKRFEEAKPLLQECTNAYIKQGWPKASFYFTLTLIHCAHELKDRNLVTNSCLKLLEADFELTDEEYKCIIGYLLESVAKEDESEGSIIYLNLPHSFVNLSIVAEDSCLKSVTGDNVTLHISSNMLPRFKGDDITFKNLAVYYAHYPENLLDSEKIIVFNASSDFVANCGVLKEPISVCGKPVSQGLFTLDRFELTLGRVHFTQMPIHTKKELPQLSVSLPVSGASIKPHFPHWVPLDSGIPTVLSLIFDPHEDSFDSVSCTVIFNESPLPEGTDISFALEDGEEESTKTDSQGKAMFSHSVKPPAKLKVSLPFPEDLARSKIGKVGNASIIFRIDAFCSQKDIDFTFTEEAKVRFSRPFDVYQWWEPLDTTGNNKDIFIQTSVRSLAAECVSIVGKPVLEPSHIFCIGRTDESPDIIVEPQNEALLAFQSPCDRTGTTNFTVDINFRTSFLPENTCYTFSHKFDVVRSVPSFVFSMSSPVSSDRICSSIPVIAKIRRNPDIDDTSIDPTELRAFLNISPGSPWVLCGKKFVSPVLDESGEFWTCLFTILSVRPGLHTLPTLTLIPQKQSQNPKPISTQLEGVLPYIVIETESHATFSCLQTNNSSSDKIASRRSSLDSSADLVVLWFDPKSFSSNPWSEVYMRRKNDPSQRMQVSLMTFSTVSSFEDWVRGIGWNVIERFADEGRLRIVISWLCIGRGNNPVGMSFLLFIQQVPCLLQTEAIIQCTSIPDELRGFNRIFCTKDPKEMMDKIFAKPPLFESKDSSDSSDDDSDSDSDSDSD